MSPAAKKTTKPKAETETPEAPPQEAPEEKPDEAPAEEPQKDESDSPPVEVPTRPVSPEQQARERHAQLRRHNARSGGGRVNENELHEQNQLHLRRTAGEKW